MSNQDLDKPLWQLTTGEFLQLINTIQVTQTQDKTQPREVYGIEGLASILGCSKSTAGKIKATGALDGAITQIKRKVITDADEALRLAKIYYNNKPNLITKNNNKQ
jgi:hypothetical protein